MADPRYATALEYAAILADSPFARPDSATEAIEMELDAAALVIDQFCHRSFRAGTECTSVYWVEPEEQYIDGADEYHILPIGDTVSVSAVTVRGRALDADEYVLEPSIETPGWTNDQLRLVDNSSYWYGRVEVTRVPGWASVPLPVKLCSIELAARRRLETPTAFGDSLNAQQVVAGDTRSLLWRYLKSYTRQLVG